MSETLYVVDKVFARNRLHLIFGPPRSGRSTLLIQTEWDWCNGREVFGGASFPAHFVHIDCLRPLADVKEHMRELGADPAHIPTISLLESTSNEERTIDAVFAQAQRLLPSVRVIFLDGIQSLCHGNITYQRDVVNFMAHGTQQCIRRGITIIATGSTSKAAELNGSTPVLQRVIGSASWVELSATLMHLGPTNPAKFTAPERTLSISIPRAAPRELAYTFTDAGRLEYISDAASFPLLDQWLVQITPGSEITSKDIVDAAAQRDYSRSGAYLWVQEQVQLGTLVLVQRGTYRKPEAPPVAN
jgi:RecA-family ATPase